ncbi:MAG TPA: hypothetical protein DIT40_08265 [Alphaproteobacteria bacterium]|nr:hypothetical protein [Alphaproteobacteria bacterium]
MHAENRLINGGFEIGAFGQSGAASNWLFAAKSATALDGLTYVANPSPGKGGQKSWGAVATDAGAWWRIGRRFRVVPGETWRINLAVWVDDVGATAGITDPDWIGEDDGILHIRYFDEAGEYVGQNASVGFLRRWYLDNGNTVPASQTWLDLTFARTVPASAASAEIWLVAVDGNSATVSAPANYETWASGNAVVQFDDVEIYNEDGETIELAQSVADFFSQVYTITEVDAVIAAEVTTLNTSIGAVSALLASDYYTAVATDSAIAAAQTALQTNIDSLSATLTSDYATSVDMQQAISVAQLQVSAAVTSNQLGFVQDSLHFTGSTGAGAPETTPDLSAWEFTNTVEGRAARNAANTGSNDWCLQRQVLPFVPAHTYRLRVRARTSGSVTPDGSGHINLVIRSLDSAFALVGSEVSQAETITGGWATYELTFEAPGSVSGAYLRAGAYKRAAVTGTGYVHIAWVEFTDITDEAATNATVSVVASAVTDLEGNASASLVFTVDAGDPGRLLLVSAADLGAEPSAAFIVDTTYFKIASDMTIFQGGIVQSDNYAETGGVPIAGWLLDGPNGLIKGANVIAGRAVIAGELNVIHRAKASADVTSDNRTSWIDVPGATFDLSAAPFKDDEGTAGFEKNPVTIEVQGEFSTAFPMAFGVTFRLQGNSGGGWENIPESTIVIRDQITSGDVARPLSAFVTIPANLLAYDDIKVVQRLADRVSEFPCPEVTIEDFAVVITQNNRG